MINYLNGDVRHKFREYEKRLGIPKKDSFVHSFKFVVSAPGTNEEAGAPQPSGSSDAGSARTNEQQPPAVPSEQQQPSSDAPSAVDNVSDNVKRETASTALQEELLTNKGNALATDSSCESLLHNSGVPSAAAEIELPFTNISALDDKHPASTISSAICPFTLSSSSSIVSSPPEVFPSVGSHTTTNSTSYKPEPIEQWPGQLPSESIDAKPQSNPTSSFSSADRSCASGIAPQPLISSSLASARGAYAPLSSAFSSNFPATRPAAYAPLGGAEFAGSSAPQQPRNNPPITQGLTNYAALSAHYATRYTIR